MGVQRLATAPLSGAVGIGLPPSPGAAGALEEGSVWSGEEAPATAALLGGHRLTVAGLLPPGSEVPGEAASRLGAPPPPGGGPEGHGEPRSPAAAVRVQRSAGLLPPPARPPLERGAAGAQPFWPRAPAPFPTGSAAEAPGPPPAGGGFQPNGTWELPPRTDHAPSVASPPPSEPAVQRAPDEPSTPPTGQATLAVAAEPPAEAPGEAQGQGHAGGMDMDDLARRLYPKIRPYLKRELWLDRERAGMLADLG